MPARARTRPQGRLLCNGTCPISDGALKGQMLQESTPSPFPWPGSQEGHAPTAHVLRNAQVGPSQYPATMRATRRVHGSETSAEDSAVRPACTSLHDDPSPSSLHITCALEEEQSNDVERCAPARSRGLLTTMIRAVLQMAGSVQICQLQLQWLASSRAACWPTLPAGTPAMGSAKPGSHQNGLTRKRPSSTRAQRRCSGLASWYHQT